MKNLKSLYERALTRAEQIAVQKLGIPSRHFNYRTVRCVPFDELLSRVSDKRDGRVIYRSSQHTRLRRLPINISKQHELNNVQNRSGLTFRDLSNYVIRDQTILELNNLDVSTSVDDFGNQFCSLITDTEECIVHGTSIPKANAFRESARLQIDRACWVLEMWWGNYYHWMTCILPKISLLQDVMKEDMPPIIIPKYAIGLYDILRDSLETIGIPREKFILLPETKFRIKKAILVDIDRFDIHALNCLKSKLIKHCTFSANSFFYVGRSDNSKRILGNELELLTRLTDYGYEIVEPNKLDLAQQIATFSKARAIVSLHGAGLTNMLFAPPGCNVVEIVDLNDPVPLFYGLASALGHRYWFSLGHRKSNSLQSPVVVNADVQNVDSIIHKIAR